MRFIGFLLWLLVATVPAHAQFGFAGVQGSTGVHPIAPNAVASSTLKVWLEADVGCLTSAPAACADGDTVATWQDQSGNGNNATKCTNGPGFNTNVFPNGKPAIQFFDPSALCMTTAYAGTAGTVIVVYFFNGEGSTAYTSVISGKPQAGASITAYDIYAQTPPINTTPSGTFSQRIFSYGTTSDSTNYTYFTNVERYKNIWSIAGMTNDGTTLNAYEQNTLLASATIPGGATVYTATGQVIGAGDYGGTIGGGPSYFSGMIAEVITYQGKISASDYAGVVAWLQNKYGITPSGNYLMMAANRAGGAYTDSNMYMMQSIDGVNWPYSLPVNYVPTLLSGQTATATLAPQMLHDDQGFLVKYNGKYWVENSRCPFNNGIAWPCHLVDILYSTDLVHWTLSGTIDCDAVTGSSNSTRGCFNDGWFIDRGNSNAVYAFFNASINEQNSAGVQPYAAAVTLNADGSFTLGAITALAGSSFPFGSTGTPLTGLFVENIVDLSGTYYAFFSNLAAFTKIYWATSSSPFTGYNGANGNLFATGGTSVEWPSWLQNGGNGKIYWDAATPGEAVATDSALGTVSGVVAGSPTYPTARTQTGFVPQSLNVVRVPAVILP